MDPMKEAPENILTKDDVRNIFGNIRIILTYNQELLRSVQERVNDWADETLIGDIFLRMVCLQAWYSLVVIVIVVLVRRRHWGLLVLSMRIGCLVRF
jgi:hypothetical protein